MRLASRIDASVNWVTSFGKGAIETRYVHRKLDAIVAYVSSHSGCRMGCRFCFLTAQQQQSFDHVDIPMYEQQVRQVLQHHALVSPSSSAALQPIRLNVNMMARGEALANKHVINDFPTLHERLHRLAYLEYGLPMRIKVSTIMPKTLGPRKLTDIFKGRPAQVYYSLYSTRQAFRDHWFTPMAMDPDDALAKLQEYADSTSPWLDTPVVFHWAYIKGYNDSLEEARELAKRLRPFAGKAKFNLVRYNPHHSLPDSDRQEADPKRLQELFSIIADALQHPGSYIVPRVGPDVYASCGMFQPSAASVASS